MIEAEAIQSWSAELQARVKDPGKQQVLLREHPELTQHAQDLLEAYRIQAQVKIRPCAERVFIRRTLLSSLVALHTLLRRSGESKYSLKKLRQFLESEGAIYSRLFQAHYRRWHAEASSSHTLQNYRVKDLKERLRSPFRFSRVSRHDLKKLVRESDARLKFAVFLSSSQFWARGEDLEGASHIEAHERLRLDLEDFQARYEDQLSDTDHQALNGAIQYLGQSVQLAITFLKSNRLFWSQKKKSLLAPGEHRNRVKDLVWYLEQQVCALCPGEVFLIPLRLFANDGYHHVCVEFRCEADKGYRFSIVNTGCGVGLASPVAVLNGADSTLQFESVGGLDLKALCSPDLLSMLVRAATLHAYPTRHRAQDLPFEVVTVDSLYSGLVRYFSGVGETFEWWGPSFSEQSNGSCSISAPLAWLRGQLSEELFAVFELYQTRRSLNELVHLYEGVKLSPHLIKRFFHGGSHLGLRSRKGEVELCSLKGSKLVSALLELGVQSYAVRQTSLKKMALDPDKQACVRDLGRPLKGLTRILKASWKVRNSASSQSTLQKVHALWFGEAPKKGPPSALRRALWYSDYHRHPSFQQSLSAFFGPQLQKVYRGEIELKTPKDRLAYIILAHTIALHILGRCPEWEKSEALAIKACEEGCARGEDQELSPIERFHFFRPWLSSEQVELVAKGVQKLKEASQKASHQDRDFLERMLRTYRKKLIWLKYEAEKQAFFIE